MDTLFDIEPDGETPNTSAPLSASPAPAQAPVETVAAVEVLDLVETPAQAVVEAVEKMAEAAQQSVSQEEKPTGPILLAVDGNSLAHRAHHAYERTDMRSAAGRPVWAVYGFLALLAGICDKVKPAGIVVGFDSRNNARKLIEPLYKAQRSEKAPELYQQMEDIQLVLAELGIPVVVPEGQEADDVVGSAAATAEKAGWRCVIATSDRDSFSLITRQTLVLRLLSGLDNAVWFTREVLKEKYGVWPEQYIFLSSLRGDPSDNLSGVRGVGEKGAVKLLSTFGTLEKALDPENRGQLETVMGRATSAKLLTDEATANIARNLQIMAIARDVPVDLEAARLSTTVSQVDAVAKKWELPSLRQRLILHLVTDEAAERGVVAQASAGEIDAEYEAQVAAEADAIAAEDWSEGLIPAARREMARESVSTARISTLNTLTPPSEVKVSHLGQRRPSRIAATL